MLATSQSFRTRKPRRCRRARRARRASVRARVREDGGAREQVVGIASRGARASASTASARDARRRTPCARRWSCFTRASVALSMGCGQRAAAAARSPGALPVAGVARRRATRTRSALRGPTACARDAGRARAGPGPTGRSSWCATGWRVTRGARVGGRARWRRAPQRAFEQIGPPGLALRRALRAGRARGRGGVPAALWPATALATARGARRASGPHRDDLALAARRAPGPRSRVARAAPRRGACAGARGDRGRRRGARRPARSCCSTTCRASSIARGRHALFACPAGRRRGRSFSPPRAPSSSRHRRLRRR